MPRTVQLPKKLSKLHSTTGDCSNNEKSRLLIHDPATNYRFLIDTGADVSVLPCPVGQRNNHTPGFPVYAANNSRIQTFGTQIHQQTLGLRKTIPWRFIRADVASSRNQPTRK